MSGCKLSITKENVTFLHAVVSFSRYEVHSQHAKGFIKMKKKENDFKLIVTGPKYMQSIWK